MRCRRMWGSNSPPDAERARALGMSTRKKRRPEAAEFSLGG
jgi:hypothetical protein